MYAYAQVPAANFSATPVAGCSPLVVSFTDLSTNAPTTWSWDFGNGATSSLQNPTTTYFNPGTYTISLTVTNASGSNTLTRTQYITVYEPPTVDFAGTPLSGCFPLRVQFTDASSAGIGNTNTSWLWDFGNGTQSTQQNPFIVFTSSGNFTVAVKVTNDKGCSKLLAKPNYIQVSPGVKAAFSNTQTTVCRPPSSINFLNSSTGPGTLSYSWDFGDGNTSAVQNPTNIYATPGTFTATLAVTSSSGCTDTITAPVTIINNNTNITAADTVCVNTAVSFSNSSTPAPSSALWNFGDGGTANTINTIHTYTTPGNYVINLYNTYSSCQDSTTHNLYVAPRPVSNFTAPVLTKCEPPLTVNFQDLSTGAVSWNWNFGDGGTSTLQNPTHTYSSYGSFTVTLITTNALGCTDTLIRPNYVRIQRAQIAIPSLPARGCLPYTINPVANITALDAVTSYFWDFGDGATSTAANPSHTYTVQGSYTVKLVITTSSGCTDSLIIPNAVRVGTHPTANFTAAPTTVCAFQPVQFTDLSPAPVDEWTWFFGDGSSSSLQNPSHIYSDTGYFTVTLVATNFGCTDTLRIQNYIRVLPPIARFTFTPSCSNKLFYTFTDQSIGPVTSWLWDFGDGNTSTAQNPNHTYGALGAYSVSLTVTNGSCSNTITHSINAIDISPDFVADKLIACHSATIGFTATNVDPTLLTNFSWDFGDGTIIPTYTGSNILHTYTNSGWFSVQLITTDSNGCTDSIRKVNYIRINGPNANFSTNTPSTGCKGLTVNFTDNSTTDGLNNITQWIWDFGDGTGNHVFNSPPFNHTYDTAGTFSVKLIVVDASGCRDSLIQYNVVTTSDPVALFSAIETQTCPGAQVTFLNRSIATNYTSLWDFGDGVTSTNNSPARSYTANGLYTVTLTITDQNNCSDTFSIPQYITVNTPTADFTISDSISSCAPLEVDFTNTSKYYSTFYWDLGLGGLSTVQNPIAYYTVPGTYTAKLVVTSPGGCVDSVFKTIILSDTTGSFINYNPFNGCKPLQLNLNAYTPGQVTYIWDYGDGNVDSTSTPNISHIYNTFGDFIPKVILKDPSGCLIPLTGPDTVHIKGVFAKFGLDKRFFCDSGYVNFTDSSTFNDNIISYNWNFGDGSSAVIQNPVHNYISPGIYTISLNVQTNNGCQDTYTLVDTVKVVASPLIDVIGDTSVCVFDPMLLSGTFLRTDTSTVQWSWTFPNGNNATVQNPSQQIYNTAGTFQVATIATNSSGCKDTVIRNIIVYPLPQVTMPGTITMQAGFPVTIPATYSSNVTTYTWTPTSTLSCSNCPQPTASPKFNTNYRVSFVDSNGCKNTEQLTILVICKNANAFIPNTFSPNNDGVNDVFYPRGIGLNRAKSLRIFNRWGEVVFEAKDFPVNDPAYGWNGTYKNNKPQAGVYVYQMEVFCDNGDIIKIDGNVALIL